MDFESESVSHPVVPNSLQPHGSSPGYFVHGILQARILEWEATPFSRGIYPTQELNLGLPSCRQILYCLSHQGSPQWILYLHKYFTHICICIHQILRVNNR